MRNEEKISASLRRTSLFVGFLVIFIHLVTCLQIGIASLNPVNWMNTKVDELEANGEMFATGTTAQKYILGLYLTTQTLTTVGYGDI
jgi:hypothetical protein